MPPNGSTPRPRRERHVPRSCERCGADFLAPEYRVRQGWGRFCSRKCARSAGATPDEAFWLYVDRSGGPDACWPWTGHTMRGNMGYGRLTRGRETVLAHRLSWLIHFGAIPDETPCVLHRCDNPPCVNPAHLFLGTRADNNADRNAKGRARWVRGERQGLAKLSEEAVRDIRDRYQRGGVTMAELAAQYGVAISTVSHALSGYTWSHVR